MADGKNGVNLTKQRQAVSTKANNHAHKSKPNYKSDTPSTNRNDSVIILVQHHHRNRAKQPTLHTQSTTSCSLLQPPPPAQLMPKCINRSVSKQQHSDPRKTSSLPIHHLIRSKHVVHHSIKARMKQTTTIVVDVVQWPRKRSNIRTVYKMMCPLHQRCQPS